MKDYYENIKSIRKLRVLMLVLIGIGFSGAIISAIIAAEIYGDYPSAGSIAIIALFFLIMISPLFLLFLYKMLTKKINNKIVEDYGTEISKKQTYVIFHNVMFPYYYGYRSTICQELSFSATCMADKKGQLCCYWDAVQKVAVFEKKADRYKKTSGETVIGIFVAHSGQTKGFFLPCENYFYYLVKTFWGKEIINEEVALEKISKAKYSVK